MKYQVPTMQPLGRAIHLVESGGGAGKPNNLCSDSSDPSNGTNGAYEVDE
ncbi:hypothetical protein [Granulicella sp. L60]|nr:hypothetical protein [Granulicella sp. L60]